MCLANVCVKEVHNTYINCAYLKKKITIIIVSLKDTSTLGNFITVTVGGAIWLKFSEEKHRPEDMVRSPHSI